MGMCLKERISHNSGFTMIELVSAIVIVSIVSIMAGMGLVQLAKGYYLAKTSTVSSVKVHIALTRLSKELSALQGISEASPSSITYTRAGAPHTITWSGTDQTLTLDGDILIDGVQSCTFTYHNTYTAGASFYSSATSIIEVNLTLKGYEETPLTFVSRYCI